jgi:hypothetical protein
MEPPDLLIDGPLSEQTEWPSPLQENVETGHGQRMQYEWQQGESQKEQGPSEDRN